MINIWALNKENSIKQLLIRLEDVFGKNAFHVASLQYTNEMSVRISPPDGSMTIYIYSYSQNSGHYGVHFEFPITQEEEIHDEVPLPRLIEMLGLYLT